ncbi:helix-turn-helix domain-containing protein [Spongiactinospora sp. 9N601]|uniref:helix-turn-helix domain-containing protein n=1 Tax=Spongiactinospora sp. 9N601 TaxID=3375149 RepID=UPI0037950F86
MASDTTGHLATPDQPGTAVAGANIAVLRKAAGLTQDQLAQRANVSKSLLSKVEVGDRPASHALVTAVARALRVPIERIHGQPYDAATTHAPIDELRPALRAYDLPPGEQDAVRPLAALRAEISAISELRSRGLYTRLGALLPGLLRELTSAVLSTTGRNRRTASGLLVSGYYAAHGLAYRLGHGDLSESIEHKLAWAAAQSEDPLAVGLADWTRVNSFQAAGDYDHGLHLLDRARVALDPHLQADPAAIVLAGSMHLRAITLASRAGEAAAVEEHLRAAQRLAADLGTDDQQHYHLTFGPANIHIHAVAAHVELGHVDQAIALGKSYVPSASVPPTRAGHHYIDLARAHLMAGDRPAVLHALRRSRQIAPEQTRYHPMVRETARVLISLHRRSNPDLSHLASWLGLTV